MPNGLTAPGSPPPRGRGQQKETTMDNPTTTCDTLAGTPTTDDSGFTLVEILIAIVLIGVLSAVAVVGVNSLTSRGSESACEASLDAAKAATVVYFAAHDNTYPADFTELTDGTDPALELPSEASVSTDELSAEAGTWTLTMTPGVDGAKPTYSCG